jgi:asparagine synthase (glutamine-hydrolysing)
MALWLRTELAPLAREILSPHEIKQVGYLNPAGIDSLVHDHLVGRANHENKLWALINLVCWHQALRSHAEPLRATPTPSAPEPAVALRP